MKIIVGGAGSVGKSIVAYLSRGNNDVAVVDEDERKLNEVAREWDVMPVWVWSPILTCCKRPKPAKATC